MTRDEKIDAMTDQAAAASETEIIRRLAVACANDALILRVIGDQADYRDLAGTMTIDAIIEVANREFEELDDNGRDALRDTVCDHIQQAVVKAVQHVWTVSHALQLDPTIAAPDTIALIAALHVIPADATHPVS
jgi:hypothetical protein